MRNQIIAFAVGASALGAVPAFAQDTGPADRPFSGFYVGGSFGYTAQPSNSRETLVFDRNLDGTFAHSESARDIVV